jgi:hypothetical protein
MVSPETLAHRPVDPRAAARLRADQLVALPDLWDDHTEAALADEARSAWTTAQPPSIGPTRRVADGRPGRRPTLLASGATLELLHHDLAGVARSLTGQALVPSFASYYFYDGNDEVRLHLDTDQCDLTMIAEVLGDLGPLHVHPELAGMTIDELFALEGDPTWDRRSGRPLHHPRSGVTAFRGRRLPHHRPGHSFDGVGAVAALHYRARYS